jgi:hypothetical protein
MNSMRALYHLYWCFFRILKKLHGSWKETCGVFCLLRFLYRFLRIILLVGIGYGYITLPSSLTTPDDRFGLAVDKWNKYCEPHHIDGDGDRGVV